MRGLRGAGLIGAVALALVLVGCSSGGATPTRTVTVTVHAAGAPSSTASARPSRTAHPTPSPTATAFSGDCGSLLSLFDVQRAAGAPLSGKTAFVVGVPEKDIGRLTYLNCRYGLASATAVPQVEIGASIYRTPADAQQRITATVQEYESAGARAEQVRVAGRSAVILTGGRGAAYDVPTLVLADGQQTVAVSVAIPGQSAARQRRALVAIGALAVQNLSG